jgi:hypothetical protein
MTSPLSRALGCSPKLLRHALEAATRRNMANISIAAALRLAGA